MAMALSSHIQVMVPSARSPASFSMSGAERGEVDRHRLGAGHAEQGLHRVPLTLVVHPPAHRAETPAVVGVVLGPVHRVEHVDVLADVVDHAVVVGAVPVLGHVAVRRPDAEEQAAVAGGLGGERVLGHRVRMV